MLIWLAVMAGGALGSGLRHGANVVINHLAGTSVPYATAFVNIVGCAVIGVLAGFTSSGHMHMSLNARAFVFVGILGGFTTFSSFGLDTLTLVRDGMWMTAAINVLAQVVLGLAAVFVGYRLAR